MAWLQRESSVRRGGVDGNGRGTRGGGARVRALFTFSGTTVNMFSAGDGYALTNPSQGAGVNTGLGSEFRGVSSTGQYPTTGSLTTATPRRAAIATYKLQTQSPPP